MPKGTRTSASDTPPRSGGLVVDTRDREAVRAFYVAHYVKSEQVESEWNGSVDRGVPGDTSIAFREAVIDRVNFFRAMAGVPADVRLDLETSPKAQRAALMMSAANHLSHEPDRTWPDYSAAGAEAAGHSNLSLDEEGPTAITGQMEDRGEWNFSVGHRRWILYPQTRSMGTGDVDSTDVHKAANVLWVQEAATMNSPRPVTRDPFVAWPPPGYVPVPLVFKRWSLSIANADFAEATITMTQDGKAKAVTVLDRKDDGYGENTLVWEPDDWVWQDADVSFVVEVRNIHIPGAVRDVRYVVTAFAPPPTW